MCGVVSAAVGSTAASTALTDRVDAIDRLRSVEGCQEPTARPAARRSGIPPTQLVDRSYSSYGEACDTGFRNTTNAVGGSFTLSPNTLCGAFGERGSTLPQLRCSESLN